MVLIGILNVRFGVALRKVLELKSHRNTLGSCGLIISFKTSLN